MNDFSPFSSSHCKNHAAFEQNWRRARAHPYVAHAARRGFPSQATVEVVAVHSFSSKVSERHGVRQSPASDEA